MENATFPFPKANHRLAPPALWFNVGLCCLALTLAGCEKQAVTSATPATGSPAAASSASATPPPAESIVTGGQSKETVDLWSDAVKSQWAGIETAVVNGAPLGAEAGAFFHQSVGVIDPAALQTQEVFQDPSFKVTETGLPSGVDQGPMIELDVEAFIRALREQVGHVAGSSDNALHFKLYGITAGEGRLKTRQRLTARGTRNGNWVDSYAVVDATWVTPAADAPGGKPL